MRRVARIAAQVALIGASSLPFAVVVPDVVSAHRAQERAEARERDRPPASHPPLYLTR